MGTLPSTARVVWSVAFDVAGAIAIHSWPK
jgi:hypothetical protein